MIFRDEITYLKKYFRDKRRTMVFFFIFSIIFMMIMFLQRMPLYPLLYAFILCLAFSFVFFLFDFNKYRQRNKILVGLKKSIDESLENLPYPETFGEENYHDLLNLLYDERLKKSFDSETQLQDMMDYYTMWAHQIKTPIAAMKLVLNSQSNIVEDNVKRSLNMELFKIEQYVEMVLSYMRLESQSTDYVIRKYDLDKMIRQSVKKFSNQFIMKKISLNFEETGLQVITDEKWLEFVFDQIIANAIKYTDEGSISIRGHKSCSRTLIIEDTGIGIAEEDLPRIFEKGFTGYNGRIQKKSTGIGLFLSKKIIKVLGHDINIESHPGKGTKVYIDFNETKILHE